jgi:uncharacterized protein
MRTAAGLPADIGQRLATLGDALKDVSPAIEFAYLFGSAAKGTLHPRSDVDLAIHVAPAADAHVLQRRVATTAGRHLKTDAVHVVLLNSAPISVAGRVLTGRQVLVDREPFARHRYESVIGRQFQDFRIREHRLLAERYARG